MYIQLDVATKITRIGGLDGLVAQALRLHERIFCLMLPNFKMSLNTNSLSNPPWKSPSTLSNASSAVAGLISIRSVVTGLCVGENRGAMPDVVPACPGTFGATALSTDFTGIEIWPSQALLTLPSVYLRTVLDRSQRKLSDMWVSIFFLRSTTSVFICDMVSSV
jgi:hypothetical protein